MKKTFLLLVFNLLISANIQAQDWIQTGSDIYGETDHDFFGTSVSISANGSILAISSPSFDNGGNNLGYVKVLKNNNGDWTQIGQTITGNIDRFFGNSVSLSADGSTLAIGSQFYGNNYATNSCGLVRIYKYIEGNWLQAGLDFIVDGDSNFLGKSVSLSNDGSIVAIGANGFDGNGIDSGLVKIYKYYPATNNWEQIGQDIVGNPEDNSGYSVSLNGDGTIVAIGSYYHNGPNGTHSGCTRIYHLENDTWIQTGATIEGEHAEDYSGASICLNDDGSIVAIGANGYDNNGIFNGAVRVFQNNNGTWVQTGANIIGEFGGNQLGFSVSLNDDGSILAIGAPGYIGNGLHSGQLKIFQNINNIWTQIGSNIDGEADEDHCGMSVSLSADGSIVATGSPYNDDNGIDSGNVRVFSNTSLDITEFEDADISIFPNPSNGTFTIKNPEAYNMIITDITGKIVFQSQKSVFEKIDLTKTGVYIINFWSNTKSFSTKVIVK